MKNVESSRHCEYGNTNNAGTSPDRFSNPDPDLWETFSNPDPVTPPRALVPAAWNYMKIQIQINY